jgi:hypothetical protein
MEGDSIYEIGLSPISFTLYVLISDTTLIFQDKRINLAKLYSQLKMNGVDKRKAN